MIFRLNPKFYQNWQCSGLRYTLQITTKCCTCHDSYTVVTCAICGCDRIFLLEEWLIIADIPYMRFHCMTVWYSAGSNHIMSILVLIIPWHPNTLRLTYCGLSHISKWTFVQVTVRCLVVPSHCMNRSLLSINDLPIPKFCLKYLTSQQHHPMAN